MKHLNYMILSICLSLIYINANAQGLPARQEANLDQVYSQYNLTGDGAIVAIIDRGIDYFHPDFIDENGDTRILYLYDMINPAGANDPDNPYGVGTIFTAEELNISLDANGTALSMDRFGHGTATTGIASGDGSGTDDLAFQGVAPGAKIIAIKATQDYFPAFDDQPAQDAFFNPDYIPIALQFISDKVGNLPCVALINMGSIGGPTDGTSTVARAMDDFVNQGHTLVCGVGDDGGAENHASTSIGQNQYIDLKIQKGDAGYLRLDLWYDEADHFEVTITRPNNTTEGPFPAPSTANDSDDRFLTGINYYHRGANVDFFGATSNRRELLIDFSGAQGEYTITLKGTSISGSGKFHAVLNPSTYHNSNKFLSHVVEGYSLNDYTSAEQVISPGDYVVKNDYVDMDGNTRQFTGQGDPGELWIGSSWGPTHDDRMGIDFAACGELLFAAYSPDTWYSHFPHLLIQGGDNNYGIQNAVSAAAPLTTGVIALMLEMNPNLTPSQVREILQNSAREDSFTGSTPNNNWGYGKLDALAAIKEVAALGISDFHKDIQFFDIYPNPADDYINIDFKELDKLEPSNIMITNVSGQHVMQIPVEDLDKHIDISHLKRGMYHVLIFGDHGSFSSRFIKQ